MGKKTGAASRKDASEAICFRLVAGNGRWKHCWSHVVVHLEGLTVGCGQAARDVSSGSVDVSGLFAVKSNRTNNRGSSVSRACLNMEPSTKMNKF
jgi:hypothetical protein